MEVDNGNGTATVDQQPVNRTFGDEQKQLARKVAILGKAPSSVALAPYDDPSWEIWILNTLGSNRECPRWDRQYELHELKLTEAKPYGNYNQWLKQQSQGKRPVFLRDTPPPDWGEGARGYPLDEIKKVFAHLPRLYLTNTVSLMVCHALLEHLKGETISHIGLWGVDMAQHNIGGNAGAAAWFTSEYARQRPSCEFWVGIACGMGISVEVAEQSDLLRAPCIYGYHHTESFKKMQARRRELEQRIGHAQQIEQQKHDEAIYLAGALESTNYELQSNYYPEK